MTESSGGGRSSATGHGGTQANASDQRSAGRIAGERLAVKKPCVVCGSECDGKARVKDPQGRYYCRACYDRKSAEVEAKTGRAVRSPYDPPSADAPYEASHGADEGAMNFAALAAAAAAAPVDATAMATCPSCHGALTPGSVFCVGCGHDLRTGAKASVKVIRAPKSTGPSPFGRGGSIGSGAAGGGSMAGIGWTLGLGSSVVTLIAVLTMLADGVARGLLRNGAPPDLGGSGVGPSPVATPYFLGTLVGAALVGFLWSYVGPWWFRTRVGWAGGSADSDAARSSYFATVLPYTLVAGLGALVALTSGTTSAAFLTVQLFGFAVLFIGCIGLFWIAKNAFGAKTLGGLFLLVALPWAWYIAQIVLLLASVAILEGLKAAEHRGGPGPSVPRARAAPREEAAPRASALSQVHEATSTHPIRIQYPNDWTLVEIPKSQPKASGVTLTAPSRATVAVNVATDRINMDEWERILLRGYRSQGAFITNGSPVNSIGRWAGVGRSFILDRRGNRMMLRLVMAQSDDGHWLMIEMVTHSPDQFGDEAMVARILDTITVSGP